MNGGVNIDKITFFLTFILWVENGSKRHLLVYISPEPCRANIDVESTCWYISSLRHEMYVFIRPLTIFIVN